MTVRELIEKLKEMPGDAVVVCLDDMVLLEIKEVDIPRVTAYYRHGMKTTKPFSGTVVELI